MTHGMSMADALVRLKQGIEAVLEPQSDASGQFTGFWDNFRRKTRTCFHHTQVFSVSQGLLVLCLYTFGILAICLKWEILQNDIVNFAFLIFVPILLAVNIKVSTRLSGSRKRDIVIRCCRVLQKLETLSKHVSWTSRYFPHLQTPSSPCVSLQWTLRDGKLVNLPWSLLVEGDVIMMHPGQFAPGVCRSQEGRDEMFPGDIFVPPKATVPEMSGPRLLPPVEMKCFVMQETPYIRNLQDAFKAAEVNRFDPFDREFDLVIRQLLQQKVLPAAIALYAAANFLRWFCFTTPLEDNLWLAVVYPCILVAVSFVPLIHPLIWSFIHLWGMARLMVKTEKLAKLTTYNVPPKVTASRLDTELDKWTEKTCFAEQIIVPAFSLEVRRKMQRFFCNSAEADFASFDLLGCLASASALCCVDKKGLLSWPNPTVEKVFFLRSKENEKKRGDSVTDDAFAGDSVLIPEVLDVSHDLFSPQNLRFDNPGWKIFSGSLKPLGLTFLLNTCNTATHDAYTSFTEYLMGEALHADDSQKLNFNSQRHYKEMLESCPYFFDDRQGISERTCLCPVSLEIGFTPKKATECFELQDQLCTFQHAEVEVFLQHSKFMKHVAKTQVKFPFPHMTGVLMKDLATNTSQLLTHGTGEIVLDSCTDAWNGEDLRLLTPALRKKILDFYHRNSLVAYCSCFSYRPLFKELKPTKGFLELPQQKQWRRNVSREEHEPRASPDDSLMYSQRKSRVRTAASALSRSLSTDSLLEDADGDSGGDGNHALRFYQAQKQQIFLGMVTMQYQVRYDAVRLVEQLEGACIRFVHFSKENELRSRVFSERMGLESGWNCHISLRKSDSANFDHSENPDEDGQDRKRSSSVPCHSVYEKDGGADGKLNRSKSVFHRQHKRQVGDLAENVELLAPPTACSSDRGSVTSGVGDDERIADSTASDEDEPPPVTFDMSNRSKLPRGIENIRPHLRDVDNVPLLVSLFTDCSPEANQEMIRIMQENGQTIVVLGSTASALNTGPFTSADVSVGFEPLYSRVCCRVPVVEETTVDVSSSPLGLASMLNAVPCAVSFGQTSLVAVLELVGEARQVMGHWRNACSFWLSSSLFVAGLLLLTPLTTLPPALRLGQVFWLCTWIIPLLAFSLALGSDQLQSSVADRLRWMELMGRPTPPFASQLSWPLARDFLRRFLLQFFPSLLIIITCYVVVNKQFDDFAGFRIAQDLCCCLSVLYLSTISFGFVDPHHHFWQRNPVRSTIWCCGVVLAVISQVIYEVLQCYLMTYAGNAGEYLPWFVFLIVFVWMLLLIPLGEAIKRVENKRNVRIEKRARLEFGTKLGMNSPF